MASSPIPTCPKCGGITSRDQHGNRSCAIGCGPLPTPDAAQAETPSPIPMLLWCPACGERHIDRYEFTTKAHHTHACQGCGMVWRPAVVPTVGVQYLPGFKDGTALTSGDGAS